MVGIIIYVFFATMTGIIQIGVRFLWVTLYRIKRGSTAPQGLLFSAMLLTFGLLALNYSVTSVVAPGYAHFGSQVYVSLCWLFLN
jgi:LMBR1 domain-containing protein 1